MRSVRAVLALLAVALTGALAACGPGGVGAGSPARSATGSPGPVPTTVPTTSELVGRWQPVLTPGQRHAWPTTPYLALGRDGSWTSSDGCNTTRGTWRVEPDGALDVTAGPSTLIGCENVAIAQAFATAALVRGDADRVVLVDDDGAALLALERAPSGVHMTHGPVRPR